MKELIQNDQIETVWIESQDRLGLGAKDTGDLFEFTKLCRQHHTKVVDLTDNIDLSDDDFQSEIITMIKNSKSKMELSDKARRTIRTRVNDFINRPKTSWPTGPHPFGYAKRCFESDGKTLKWEWQPISRTLGVAYDYKGGKRQERNGRPEKIPRKNRQDVTVLIPSENTRFVKAVQLVFEYYAKLDISRRQISRRLNDEGYTFYDKQFSHSYVTQILKNPAYIGDIHFGKMKAGELYSFEPDGTLAAVKNFNEGQKPKPRPESERIVKKDTHEGLISRELWNKAQKKLEREANDRASKNVCFATRNPNYYLKSVLVCGHCKRNMVGRTDPNSKKVSYVCSSYISGRCNGHDADCGYHSIQHEKAEELLMDKLKELGQDISPESFNSGSNDLGKRFWQLCEKDTKERNELMEAAVQRVVVATEKSMDVSTEQKRKLEVAVRRFLRFGPKSIKNDQQKKVVQVLKDIETKSVSAAKSRIEKLTKKLANVTKSWALADEDDKPILREQKNDLKLKIESWASKTKTLVEKYQELSDYYEPARQELNKLFKEIPHQEKRAKGEAYKKVFNSVELFWEKRFHPAEKKPSRPRKTNRLGRNSYTLQMDQINWDLANSNLVGSFVEDLNAVATSFIGCDYCLVVAAGNRHVERRGLA